MKIIVKVHDNPDYGTSERMNIDGKRALRVNPLWECPEDAIIGRDLVSCRDVVGFMKMAYEAGKNGEAFEYTVEECKDYED